MARKVTVTLVSDFTGAEASEDQFADVIVRSHPKVTEPKRLDVMLNELDDLKTVGDLVTLEIRNKDTTTRQVHMRHQDFAKLMPDEKLAAADGVRGRRTGYSPLINGNGH